MIIYWGINIYDAYEFRVHGDIDKLKLRLRSLNLFELHENIKAFLSNEILNTLMGKTLKFFFHFCYYMFLE